MRRRRALAAAALLHALLLAGLWALPERPRAPDDPSEPELTEIELVEYVPGKPADSPPPTTSPAEPAAAADPAPTPDPATSDPPPSAGRRERRRRPTTSDAVVLPADDGEPEPSADAATDDEPMAAPLDLSSRRADATEAGSLAPRLPRGALAEVKGRRRPRSGRSIVDPVPGGVADQVTTPAAAGFVQTRDGDWVFEDPDPGASWSATLLPDGRVRFSDDLSPQRRTDGRVAGPGLKEWVLAARGHEFWAKRKKRLLAATQDMRLRMAVQFAEKNIDRQLRRLYRDLLEIWQSDRPPRKRRELIFEIWDDCEERVAVDLGEFSKSASSKIDELRRDAGTQARAEVLAFVRRHLPEGDPEAYPAAELASLNRRRLSHERFAPYAG